MSDMDLIERLRAKVEALRSPRGGASGARDAADSSAASTASKDSGSRLNSGPGPTPLATPGHETDAAVVVNVGGVNHTTTVATLKAVESSYFSLMLNGLWEPARTREGDIFVDRNGELFSYILEHLRGECQREPGTFQLPSDLGTLNALLREAQFYRLPALVTRLHKRKEEMMVKEHQNDVVLGINAVHKTVEPVPCVELDIAYSAVSSAHCQFTEESLHNLTMRVNKQILWKGQNGFKVKDVNSRVHFNPNDPKLPYSMTCTAVLVRERSASQHTSCAAAPADRLDKCGSPIHHVRCHQPQLPICRHNSPAHSPRLDLGRYRLEENSLGRPSDAVFWHPQISTGQMPEPLAGSLRQGAEARLRMQALVAEHASRVDKPHTIVPSRRLGPRRSLSLNSISDQATNPSASAFDASTLHSPPALHSREWSSFLEGPIQNGPPGGVSWDPSIRGYSGEVQRIMGISQDACCRSNPPPVANAMEASGTAEVLCHGNGRLGRGEVGHALDLGWSLGNGDVACPGRPNELAGLGSHPCCETAGNAALELDSSSDGSMGILDGGLVAKTAVTGELAVPKEETVAGIEICWSESFDSGSLTSNTSFCEPAADSETKGSSDGQQDGVVRPLGSFGGMAAPWACEKVGDGHAIAHRNGINAESTEADSRVVSDGQDCATCCSVDGDFVRSSGFADTSMGTRVDGSIGITQSTTRSPIRGAEGTANVSLKQALHAGTKDKGIRGDDLVDFQGTVKQDMSRPTCEAAVHQPPAPDHEAQGRWAQQRFADAFGNVISPRDSRLPLDRDVFSPRGVRFGSDGGVLTPRSSRPSLRTGMFSPRGLRGPLEGDVLSPRGSRAPLERQALSPRSARGHSQREVLSPRGLPERDGGRGDTSHGYGRVAHPSRIFVQEAAVAGHASNASMVPPAHLGSSAAIAPGLSRGLVAPSKYIRYQSSKKKEGKAAYPSGRVARSGPLFVGAHDASTAQPLQHRGRFPTKAKVRSFIPLLNLAPITAAAGREGAQLVGRRPELHGSKGTPVGGLPKSENSRAVDSGPARLGVMASSLPRHAPNTASQLLSNRDRRPVGCAGAGQR